MSFDIAAGPYDRFMGRYSQLLSARMADLAVLREGAVVLDVGCGPGSLTGELVARVGASGVHAVDPSPTFAAAARERYPGVDVRESVAEALPYADGMFDAALAQLVVHFMTDPVAGLEEMRRVTRPGGVVAVCVWDHAGGRGPLSLFWRAARDLDPAVGDEFGMAGTREGELPRLLRATGLDGVESAVLSADLKHSDFGEWWEPLTYGVGPAGAYVAGLDEGRRTALRERCRALLPAGPFVVPARAWAARGVVP